MAPIPSDDVVRRADGNDAAPSSSSAAAASSPSSVAPPIVPENCELGGTAIANADGDKGKQPAWSAVPPNVATEVGSIMGAASWPSLSAAANPKSFSSSDSLKALSDDSIPDPKGSSIPSSMPQINHNAGTQSTYLGNHARPVRRKYNSNSNSVRRGNTSGTASSSGAGGSTGAFGGHLSAQPSLASSGSDNGPESFNRDLPSNGSNNWDSSRGGEYGSQLPNGGEHHKGHGGNRRGYNSNVGSHHGGYGNRREHERGNHGWHTPRGVNARDQRMSFPLMQQLHGHPRPFIQLPPPSPLPVFSAPGHVRPFLGPAPFPEMQSVFFYGPPPAPSLEPLRNVPYFPHQPPAAVPQQMIFSPPDENQIMLLRQIEFYFSPENLCRDTFLRQNMDGQGWVPVSLIAEFNRVKQLTNSIEYILDTVRASTEVEVQGHRLRKRNNWMSWILSTPTTRSSSTSDYNYVVAGVSNISIEKASSQ